MTRCLQLASIAAALVMVASCGGDGTQSTGVPPSNSPHVPLANSDTSEADVTIRATDTPEPDYAAEHALAVSLLRSSSHVETFRIHNMDYSDYKKRDDPRYRMYFIDGWPIDKRGPKMGRAYALKVADFLLDDSNFLVPRGPGGVKACVFDPGVVLRFVSGTDHIDVVICFHCNQLSVKSTKGILPKPSGDFDPGRGSLAILVREAFPNDKDLQSLP